MATTICIEDQLFFEWEFPTRNARECAYDRTFSYPYPLEWTEITQYQNKVWDEIAESWVFWNTEYPDIGGLHYNGPGIWNVETSNFSVECKVYYRHQRT